MPVPSASVSSVLPPEFLSVLLEESLAGVLYLLPAAGPDFTVAYSNPAARQLLGALAEPGYQLSHWPAAATPLGPLLHEALRQPGRVEQQLVLPTGQRPVQLRARQVGEGLLVNCQPATDAVLMEALAAQQQSEIRESAAYAEANRQREQLYHLLEQAPALICILSGPDHVFQFVNSAYQNLIGPRPLLGLPIGLALPELTGQSVFTLLDQVYQTGETFSAHEMPVQPVSAADKAAGITQRYYNFIYQARHDQQRVVNGIYVFGYDVTPQVQARQLIEQQNQELAHRVEAGLRMAERQREKQQATLHHMFEQAPVAIAILRGPALLIELANAAMGTIWECRPADTLGRPYSEVVADTAGQELEELLANVLRTGEPYHLSEAAVQIRRSHTGRPAQAYVDFMLQPLRDEQNTVTGVMVMGTEITDQVRARQQQLAHQTQLQGLFMEAPVPVAILAGAELVYQFVNPAYQQLFPGRQLLHRPLLQALPELADSPVPAMLHHVYATGETYVARELTLEVARVEGAPLETIYFTFTYQPRRNADGLIDGVLVFAYDVTPHVQARLIVEGGQQEAQLLASELQKANTQLVRANADLDTFVYMASHDLKAPITNIDGLLQALRHELALPQEQADTETVLRLMQDSVQRFQRTIKYLTEVSRWQQVQELPAASIAVADLVADVCRDLAPLLAVTGGQVHVADNSCPHLLFAEKHLRSLLYNLISNALKYRDPRRVPHVEVRCDLRPEGVAVLEVHDNGLGLTPEQQQRVFGMFQRLHDHVEGSGIGLYLAKQVVEKAGGSLSVESEHGVGSIFRATLPQLTAP